MYGGLDLRNNGVKHIRSSPCHPFSNGQVERFVQTFKRAIMVNTIVGQLLSYRLAQCLLSHRCTPHSTTGVPPSELFLKCTLKTRLDIM